MRRLALAALVLAGCQSPDSDRTLGLASDFDAAADSADAVSARVLAQNLDRLTALADSVEAALRPVPLLTSAERRALGRYSNTQHLAAARRLGVPQPVTDAARTDLVAEGRLVPLEDSEFWTVRKLDYSSALVTPDTRALLEEVGQRFQARLAAFGLPPLRFEVTSVLRTADDQARLRQTNPNAARGASAHQFGTTVDLAYSSFRAPQGPVLGLDTADVPWLAAPLRRVEALAVETGAARMSRELQAELGDVLVAMQDEGKVLALLEVRQPVYHITVAQRY
ncbi:MAG: DUF5715 family protein [Bacteroidota bacterium]